ncbi:MAG: molecular chaperone HtpG [Clostridia bacterium]|nr:molecular chaperone HtpG [Clostridia bacterium]
MEKGNISVNSENIFPIIKKWLYSDKDIFIRELVSNGCDAITKLKKLVGIGEIKLSDEDFKITVAIDKDKKQLIFEDNGIGMTKDEVEKYITDIAFSGATEFLEKYKDENDKGAQIIGHFGLGFYSAFMPSEKVEIETLSYKEGEDAVYWSCDGGMSYEIGKGERTERGTKIILTIAEDSKEFLEEFTVREVLSKYCSFVPVPIYFEVVGKEPEKDKDGNTVVPAPINEVTPLWAKAPKDCKDEDYKDFYRKVFLDFNEPLFWIHLNVDFPFNLKGILYFPKINHEFSVNEGQIKLYNNQIFVADNVKEVIPEFLMLLKGVIDCPDLPLNVSRSFLQNDGYVRKISAHITKKVADKLKEIYTKQREDYDKYWEDINVFIKYGCMRDEKFYERVKDFIVYKNLDGKHITLSEYLEGKENKDVYYVSDENLQSQYINMFREQGLDAVILPSVIDTHFISFIEMKEEGVKFKRIDSSVSETSDKDAQKDEKYDEKLVEIFKNALADDSLKIEVQALKNEDIPAIVLLSEESRRMQEMYRSYGQQFAGMGDMFKDEFTLVINSNNAIIKKLDKAEEPDKTVIAKQVFDLAMLCHKPLSAEKMTEFVKRSNELIARLI